MNQSPPAWTALHRRCASLALTVSLLGVACVYPTERGAELVVEMDSIPALIRGELRVLTAHVREVGGDPVPNAPVRYESRNPLVAIVTASGEMLATGVGETEVVASAVGVANAQSASQAVRIHGPLEIDSIAPAITQYGSTVAIYGSGLHPDSIFLASIGGVPVPIQSYTPFDPDQPHRFGVLQVWVRAPAPRFATAQVFGFNGLSQSPDSTRVVRLDIYEPNDVAPWDFGAIQGTIANPALAFEERNRDDSSAVDWYRFDHLAPQDRTILIRSDQVGPESYEVFLTDSLGFDGSDFGIGGRAWTIGRSFYTCQGIPFAPPQFPADSAVIALKGLPAGQYNLFAIYDRPGAYEMGIINAYRSALPPDAAEENDFCNVARSINIGAPPANLTIDNPHDIDWFRTTVTQAVTVDIDVVADDANADLDVYVLGDYLPDSISLVGFSQIGGTEDGVVVALAPGDYFVVVVDFRGVPTTYSFAAAATSVTSGASLTSGTFRSHPNKDAVRILPRGTDIRVRRFE